jgi:hypothetical protein
MPSQEITSWDCPVGQDQNLSSTQVIVQKKEAKLGHQAKEKMEYLSIFGLPNDCLITERRATAL